MSTKYKRGNEVPSDVLCGRLDQLSNAVCEGRVATRGEFSMRVPAEVDRDADLVLAEAARRIKQLEKDLSSAKSG